MKLFEMKDWVLTVSEEAWGLEPFHKILKRDKTKHKTKALAEMLFVWYFCDIKSNYLVMSRDTRIENLKKDINGLPPTWEPDDVIKDAVKFYMQFKTITQKLYEDALVSATDIGDYLSNTKALLAERDAQGKVVTDIAKITASVQKMPKLMQDLKIAYKEVVKEQEDNSGKKKGSKTFNTFEQGLDFENE
jgi:hypothetical protein